ncbi:hypothetical protein BC962_2311 [Gillisia mitskevichiae]|uniref:Uncharacterized protein n=1 Tax=Gillisia mitskevichiae TaxID=270921 RepID=A0A495PL14_9FLAO|nr:hypothetical protein [Gillisia mitskevichiae]RKS50540.1 hypothetical protein BC962_2311 [Gillisia mitskevichiae]
MKSITGLLNEITLKTLEIETKFPEIYKFLDEDTLTLPFREHPKINFEVLLDYLETLKQLLSHHKETHLIN